jgi:TRAP-type uncharacterized transport system fused permease subunit
MSTGFQSLKLAIAGFIVPYMFVYSDSVLLNNAAGVTEAAFVVFTAVVGVLMLAVASEDYLFARMWWALRLVVAASAVMMLNPGFVSDALGLGVAFLVTVWLWRRGCREATVGETPGSETAVSVGKEPV